MKIRKGDNVLVITGKDRGKTSTIEKVVPKENKVLVAGVNIQKHHLKPSKSNPHGGIMDIPGLIDASNVALICPHCSKPVRIAHKQSGEIKERVCRLCQGNLDVSVSAPKAKAKEKNV